MALTSHVQGQVPARKMQVTLMGHPVYRPTHVRITLVPFKVVLAVVPEHVKITLV